jgi:hypothetical protein
MLGAKVIAIRAFFNSFGKKRRSNNREIRPNGLLDAKFCVFGVFFCCKTSDKPSKYGSEVGSGGKGR